MIEFDRVTKTFVQGPREVRALQDFTLTIESGEFAAVMGPSGSGKSTFLHLAGGLDLPSTGDVRLLGDSTRRLSDDQLTLLRRQRIGFVFQFFNLIPTLRVFENVALPLLLASVPQRQAAARIEPLLERIGLAPRREHFPEELSGGEMQRVAIARALAIDPAIVLADEPTGNLDSATGQGILDILARVAMDERRTIVMVTHDHAAARCAKRLIEIRDGRLVGDSRS
jgi:putative ABC transport system ATP-binding protein